MYSLKEEKATKSARQIVMRGGEGLAAAALFVATAAPIAETTTSSARGLAAQHSLSASYNTSLLRLAA